jgi:hypothetical protein
MSIGGVMISRGMLKKCGESLLQCHFVDLESHLKLLRLNLRLHSEKPASKLLSYIMADFIFLLF